MSTPQEISNVIKLQIENYKERAKMQETGKVILVGDGIARVYGLENCMANELLDKSISVYDKNYTAKNEAKKLKEYWDKKEKLLSVFVNHNRIDDIEQAISLLNVYAKREKDPLFYEYADTVKILIHQILEDTKITMHSIFWIFIIFSA